MANRQHFSYPRDGSPNACNCAIGHDHDNEQPLDSQETDTENVDVENFSEYRAYGMYGQTVMRLSRARLEDLLDNYELWHEAQLGCWILERDGKAILARLDPICRLDGRDIREPDLVFWPYIP
jgi:hypothetical protein